VGSASTDNAIEPLREGDPAWIGGYRMLGRLGAGGMGKVFLAESPGHRFIALKVVHDVLLRESEFRARFRREVQAARQVSGAFTAPIADADPEAAETHAVSEHNRLGGAEFIVARLTAIGGLRPELTSERAVAAALVLMDPAVHRTLVREHRWTSTEYADWIERAAVAELVADKAQVPTRPRAKR